MKVCSSCESKLFVPIISKERYFGKCELCWDKQMVSRVLVGK